MLIAQVAKEVEDLPINVKSAFLNSYLKELYVEQPQKFLVKGQEEKVLKVKKALYGLKQAPGAWYSRIDSYFAKALPRA